MIQINEPVFFHEKHFSAWFRIFSYSQELTCQIVLDVSVIWR